MKRQLLVLFLPLIFSCTPTVEPPISIAELTVAEIHKAYTEGSFTAENLINAYLSEIERINDTINAITFINPDAIQIARLLDQEFASSGKLRPLHGIPLIVKDNINVAGIPTTAGSLALENYIPDENAFIIKKLVDAGAIILGKSNMAEWAFSPMHSESSTAGITRNPYNTLHVPAGSSGGTGAAIAANLGTIGLGTDTGNSIRGPSSHNALVGFRMTLGLVSRSDIVPLYLRNDVVGPMCRTVEDATRVLEVITGYDPNDPLTRYSEGHISENYTQYLDENGLSGARIGVLRTLSDNDPDPEVHQLFELALADISALGAEIIDPLVIPGFDSLRQNQWCAEFETDMEAFLGRYVKNDTIATIEDVIRIGTHSDYTRSRLKRQQGNKGRYDFPEIPCGSPFDDTLRIAFREAIENTMDSLALDAIVYPSWNHKPALIEQFSDGYKGDNSQIIAPHTGQPAFTVPMGFTTGNLPAGIQFLGRMWDEATLIKLVYSFEQGTEHRQVPDL